MENVELRNLPPLIEKIQSSILHSTFSILNSQFSRDDGTYVRFTKISRLNNTMWDKSYSSDSGAWRETNTTVRTGKIETDETLGEILRLPSYNGGLSASSTKFNGATLDAYSYSYDALSRPTTRNTDTFGYNERGEVVFSRRDAENAEDTYAYDGNGTVSTISGATTNTTEIQYFWGADLSNALQGAGGVGGLLAVSLNGLFCFPAYDNNGNITKYLDENGNVVATYEYDAFGKTISQSGPMADVFRMRFSTKCYDPENGLYYYGYRFYSPMHMRWLNRDPIEEDGGLNLYGFCGNNALSLYGVCHQ